MTLKIDTGYQQSEKVMSPKIPNLWKFTTRGRLPGRVVIASRNLPSQLPRKYRSYHDVERAPCCCHSSQYAVQIENQLLRFSVSCSYRLLSIHIRVWDNTCRALASHRVALAVSCPLDACRVSISAACRQPADRQVNVPTSRLFRPQPPAPGSLSA